MAIISRLEDDHSDVVCKSYAGQALKFLNDGVPSTAEAGVPLANLFRLLEMYRYDAFQDERRSGVLALADFGKPAVSARRPWFVHIKAALDKALLAAFGNAPKDKVVEELQKVLQELAAAKSPAKDVDVQKHRNFYSELSAALPA